MRIGGVFVCGGDPTPDDLAAVQEFAAALALPTEHLTRLALLEADTSGAPEVAAALARHAEGCDRPECADPMEPVSQPPNRATS